VAKATELFPTWQEHHHTANYGDPIREATLAEGIWTVNFIASNGLTAYGVIIRIDARTGKILSATKMLGA
jgi:hypothetical protein